MRLKQVYRPVWRFGRLRPCAVPVRIRPACVRIRTAATAVQAVGPTPFPPRLRRPGLRFSSRRRSRPDGAREQSRRAIRSAVAQISTLNVAQARAAFTPGLVLDNLTRSATTPPDFLASGGASTTTSSAAVQQRRRATDSAVGRRPLLVGSGRLEGDGQLHLELQSTADSI